MTYYVICVPCLGPADKVVWYPGHVSSSYVRVQPPPLLAAYKTTSRRQAAKTALSAARRFGHGDWPMGPVAPKNYQPQTGDVLISVVAPLAGSVDAEKYPATPRVTASFFPESRIVHAIPTIPGHGLSSLRRLELLIGLALASQSI